MSPITLSLLTPREIEVMEWLRTGLLSKEIAARLHIAKYTVDNHRKNLLRKLKARNTAELIAIYMRMKNDDK